MTDDWRDPTEILDLLAAGDDESVRTAVLGLLEFNKDGDEFDVPRIEPWVLRLFGDPPPDELVTRFARCLARYRSFVPRPRRSHVIRQLVELAVRYGVSQVIYETSIEVQGEDDPPAAARGALDYLRMRGLYKPREIAAAQTLVRYLLEAKQPVRRAATEALSTWYSTNSKRALVTAVVELADPDQRDLLLEDPPSNPARVPRMDFEDVVVRRAEFFALGVERNSGRYYVEIPAGNRLVDYAEYYEIDEDEFERYRADPASAVPFVERCRDHVEDPRLMYQPSIERGSS